MKKSKKIKAARNYIAMIRSGETGRKYDCKFYFVGKLVIYSEYYTGDGWQVVIAQPREI